VKPFLIGVAIVAGLYLLHRALLAAESRGWIFYRTRPPRVRTLGMLEELVDPTVEYRIEEESSEAIRADHADSGLGYGDDDGPG